MTGTAFLAVSSLLVMGAISPGPAVLMAARTGVTEGMRTGFFLALGIGLGAVFWCVTALAGLSALFAWAPSALWVFKIAGGCYLVWLAIGMWRHAREPLAMATGVPPRSALSALRLGLWTQLSNPKPAVLLTSIFLGTVPPDTPAWVLAALLAVCFTAETLWNTIVARVFSFEATRRGYLGAKPLLDRCFGGLLALLGLKVALS